MCVMLYAVIVQVAEVAWACAGASSRLKMSVVIDRVFISVHVSLKDCTLRLSNNKHH